MTGRAKHPGRKKDRPRGVQARSTDVYVRARKGPGALVCSDCGVVQHRGKWYWGAPPLAALREVRCPACQRIRDRYPAGTIHLHADFLEQRKEVLALIKNVERAQKDEHPLERLMDVVESDGHLVVTTTGIHLARQIAHRLARRFHKKARLHYSDKESLLRVTWE
jgi:NMD protein affecting ribosome stability and mRNA decay